MPHGTIRITKHLSRQRCWPYPPVRLERAAEQQFGLVAYVAAAPLSARRSAIVAAPAGTLGCWDQQRSRSVPNRHADSRTRHDGALHFASPRVGRGRV